MHLATLLLLASTAIAKPTPSPAPARLWATHYNGNVYTLELNNKDLSLKQTLKTCGKMPSWLTLDAQTRTVYCSNEDGTADASTHGTLTALHAAPDGQLHEIAVTNTVGGGVNSVIYEADAGKKFLAIAH
jgi:6-phosphogluconolactonase (cycloisomerase 2 family)